MDKIVGIYKITSPSNRVYIGQSSNIKERWLSYKRVNCKGQTRLYNSIIKHGVNNHKFEIIHICDKQDLDKLESHYIKTHDTFNSKNGLNLRSGGGANHTCADETKRKIREKRKRQVFTKKTKMKMSIAKKGISLTSEHVNNAARGHYKKICQYSVDGKFIKEHDSTVSASIHLCVKKENISACLNGRQKTAYGYIWKKSIQ